VPDARPLGRVMRLVQETRRTAAAMRRASPRTRQWPRTGRRPSKKFGAGDDADASLTGNGPQLRSCALQPVVPMTRLMPRFASTGAFDITASGDVKSTATSTSCHARRRHRRHGGRLGIDSTRRPLSRRSQSHLAGDDAICSVRMRCSVVAIRLRRRRCDRSPAAAHGGDADAERWHDVDVAWISNVARGGDVECAGAGEARHQSRHRHDRLKSAHERELRTIAGEAGIGVRRRAEFFDGVVLSRPLPRTRRSSSHRSSSSARSCTSASRGQEGRAIRHGASAQAHHGNSRVSPHNRVSSTRAGFIPGTHTIGFDGPAEKP